jgi:transposase
MPRRSGGARCACAPMIPVPSGVRGWLAGGRTGMRKRHERSGAAGSAGRSFRFRRARGDLIKIICHGIGLSLNVKRLSAE